MSRILIIVLALGTGYFAPSQPARAQAPMDAGGFNCSPAPCVLPPTQASEGGDSVSNRLTDCGRSAEPGTTIGGQ